MQCELFRDATSFQSLLEKVLGICIRTINISNIVRKKKTFCSVYYVQLTKIESPSHTVLLLSIWSNLSRGMEMPCPTCPTRTQPTGEVNFCVLVVRG